MVQACAHRAAEAQRRSFEGVCGLVDNEWRARFHDRMMNVQSKVVVALERAGYEPCAAIDIANEVTREGWAIWNDLMEELESLKRLRP